MILCIDKVVSPAGLSLLLVFFYVSCWLSKSVVCEMTQTLSRANSAWYSPVSKFNSNSQLGYACCLTVCAPGRPPVRRHREYLSLSLSDTQQCQRRYLHDRRRISSTSVKIEDNPSTTSPEQPSMPKSSALSSLPLSTLVRSYLITFVSTHPFLLRPTLAILSKIAHSKSPLLDPDSSRIVKFALKKTFYAQFCAGESPAEVRQTLNSLKSMGYSGVILGHAKEVVLEGSDAENFQVSEDHEEQERNREEIADWENNTTDTVKLAEEGDFVALKFTGAGRQSIQHLLAGKACDRALENAIHRVCQLSQDRGVRLLFDAEQASLQEGIDRWTMHFMKRYNKGQRALVYGTYQAYAKKTPRVLAQHLEEASKHDIVLGVKLVRGAYLGSDPRDLFWPTIEDTHKCYNSIAESLMRREYGEVLQPIEAKPLPFPKVDLVLASHNAKSVALAREIRDQQARDGQPRIEMAYGQLMGMADNVSGEIVQAAKERSQRPQKDHLDIPKAYKYLVWGTLGQCLKYLLRRAQENKDAVTRTIEARQALGAELLHRMRF